MRQVHNDSVGWGRVTWRVLRASACVRAVRAAAAPLAAWPRLWGAPVALSLRYAIVCGVLVPQHRH
jgi:hypothetical protein